MGNRPPCHLFLFLALVAAAAPGLLRPATGRAAAGEVGAGETLVVKPGSRSTQALNTEQFSGVDPGLQMGINLALCANEVEGDLVAAPLVVTVEDRIGLAGGIRAAPSTMHVWMQRGSTCAQGPAEMNNIARERWVRDESVGVAPRVLGGSRVVNTEVSVHDYLHQKGVRHGIFQCPKVTQDKPDKGADSPDTEGNQADPDGSQVPAKSEGGGAATADDGLAPQRWRLCVGLRTPAQAGAPEALATGGLPFWIGTRAPPEPTDLEVVPLHQALNVSMALPSHGEADGEAQVFYQLAPDKKCPPCEDLSAAHREGNPDVQMASSRVKKGVSGEARAAELRLAQLRPFAYYCVCAAHRDVVGNVSSRSDAARVRVHEEADPFRSVDSDFSGGYCGAAASPAWAGLSAAWLLARRARRVPRRRQPAPPG